MNLYSRQLGAFGMEACVLPLATASNCSGRRPPGWLGSHATRTESKGMRRTAIVYLV